MWSVKDHVLSYSHLAGSSSSGYHFNYELSLTRGPAGRGGRLGTHLVARGAMPVVAQPVSNHHVVLRVGRAPWHLHGGDRTWKVMIVYVT